ncbi:MAG: hypothetical protein H0T76_28640 [Nannocystis sp.]|nr:hypothetical protein [Nannocystis sp.]MBA3550462.1 hypothetical protein [Nannocystis sp.]
MLISIDSRRACALLVTLLLPACTDKNEGATDTDAAATDTAATDTDETPTTDGTEPPAAGCECADPAPCSKPLCPHIALNEDLDTGGDTDADDDLALDEALTCALEALRDGKTGRITTTSSFSNGQYVDHISLDLFGDGTARRTYGGAQDLCEYTTEDVSVRSLKGAQVFTDCLLENDVATRYDCVIGATGPATTVCQAGVQDCSGI